MRSAIGSAALLVLVAATAAEAQEAPRRFTLEGRGGFNVPTFDISDAVDGAFQVLVTDDGGARWRPVPAADLPPAQPGEGAFAASGTCLAVLKGSDQGWFVTGGARMSRVFRTFDRGKSWSSSTNPIPAGNPSSGLFSIAFSDAKIGVAVGGNYKEPTLASLNGARSDNGGRTWSAAPVSSSGFFSAVVAVPGSPARFLAVGPTGTAVTSDRGTTWRKLDATPLNAVAFSDGNTGWAVGPKGTIVRLAAN